MGKRKPFDRKLYNEVNDLSIKAVKKYLIAAGHTITAVTPNTFDFNPNDRITAFLTANCIPGTTTVYVDMDGVLTEYYQAVATYLQSIGQLPLGEWYDMSPSDESAAISSSGGSFFVNLAKRAESDALIDLVISKNGSYRVLTTDTGNPSFNTAKTNWMNTNFTGARAMAGIDFATNFDKGPFGGANKLLIDDRTDYVNQFVNAI